MKKIKLEKLAFVILGFLVLSVVAVSCKKDTVGLGNNDGEDGSVHTVDSRLVGEWMWTKGSDGAYYDDNGVYQGAAYGFATKYTVNTNGSGTCFSHVFSTLGVGTGLEVNISYKGFFETDDQGHLGFFPTSGTYKSTSGQNRALRPDELWNNQTKSGRSFVMQKLVFTTIGGRECFQVTSKDDITDTFYRLK